MPTYSKLAASIQRRLDAGTYQPVAPEPLILGEDALFEEGPVFVARTRQQWIESGGIYFTRWEPRRIGLELLALNNRTLVFDSARDIGWARDCLRSVTFPRWPRMCLRRQEAKAA